MRRAHVAGHSSGAAVAAQLALDHPEYVHTLMLLEPSLISVPSLEAFFGQVEPAFEAYASGDHAGALAIFMSAVGGVEWTKARTLLEQSLPGAVKQAIGDADTFFGIELPALTEWVFDAEQAARLDLPVLSVVGSETQPVWVEVAEFLRSALPQVDECTIDGAGHLLQIQCPEPVARANGRLPRATPHGSRPTRSVRASATQPRRSDTRASRPAPWVRAAMRLLQGAEALRRGGRVALTAGVRSVVERPRSPPRLVTATSVAGRRLVRPRQLPTERACALSNGCQLVEVVEVREPERVRVCLSGELDLAGAPIVRERLRELCQRRETVLLDLDELEFIDMSGLRVVLSAADQASRDGWQFAITRGSPRVRRLIELLPLDGRLPFDGSSA